MHRELPKAYEPAEIESRWARYWVDEHLFDVPTPALPEVATQREPKNFTQLLPPPNVTGRLHMGHMLNQTEMDILARWHRMRGERSLWVPGTDHASIATQMMVERQLAAEGTDRHALGRERFLERAWQWKTEYGNAILDQMKRLGASVDWSREYFTMDERLSPAVREAFVRLYEQGLIYRGERIVNWDPVQQTAVSDLEVEHQERAGFLYEIRYPLAHGPLPDGTDGIVVATTRPETLLGDTAVVVNPEDERYTALVGQQVIVPLAGRRVPILADDWAKPEFGTGAVKVTPAHDPNDFAIGERHALPRLTIMDATARIDLPGSPYHGLDRMAARERILDDLRTAGLLVAVKEHTLAIATSQRTGAVIEPRLSTQWFLRIQPLADKAIQAVDEGHIRFLPENHKRTYDEWMRNIHDWCLSRQLWWGHRIPAWFCDSCQKVTVARTAPEACSGCGITSIRQETDVLDTWFSSGLLPFTVFGWTGDPAQDQQNADLQAFYPTQLLVTGSDILFFWVARMIMLGCHFMLETPLPDGSARSLAQAVPFQQVYIHALVRDADRQKMSKTKGNVVDPIGIVTRFGTDAVRFTLASMASPGTDIAFSEARTEGNRAFANKIWNAARFLFLQLDRAEAAGYKVNLNSPLLTDPAPSQAIALPDDTPLESRWILSRLAAVAGAVDRALEAYRFDDAANAIYQFFWGELCDWYLELVKLRLNFPDPDNPDSGAPSSATPNPETAISLATLAGVFEISLRLLSPFMPFLTEEIWHALQNGEPPAKSIALTRYPQAADLPSDPRAEEAVATLQELIVTVRALRKELGVPEKEATQIELHADNRILALADANTDMLARMARVASVVFAEQPLTSSNARSTATFDVAVLFERQIDAVAERERLQKEMARLEKALAAAARQLGNESFLAKAPEAVVAGLRTQQAENQSLMHKAQAALDALPSA